MLEFAGPEEAQQIYRALKKLESGEFKDSKLRDQNGGLMIVWHGSPRKFDQFKTDAKGEYRWRNKGVHFSSSREVIEQYSDKAMSALNVILYDLAVETYGNKAQRELTVEQTKEAIKIYNEIVADLIQNGKDSQYYHADPNNPDLDYIKYKNRRFGVEWALEPFNGELPNKDNSDLNPDLGLYIGNDIGKYEYAAVLNIEKPFKTDTTDMDFGFEQGEKSHAEQATDGTILFHQEAVSGMGGIKIDATKDTYSVGVFDPSKIRVLGRIENGRFALSDEIRQ